MLRRSKNTQNAPIWRVFLLSKLGSSHFLSKFPPMSTTASLTSSDIDRIANLARLELSAPESAKMLGQLNGFFAIVEQMRAVDTTGVEPLSHPVGAISDITLRLRADVVSETNQRSAHQRSAPLVDAGSGLFLVPKVIE
jgi:aspartyl-tRNA(Asn)/glutamyl-tRNA(Gln) amidotransferase subunit C